MENEIKNLIQLNIIRDIQIAMLRKKGEGLIINENIINEILFDLEVLLKETKEAEIDEGGEELDEEDKEKIADAVDTEDLGAKADMEYSKEKDERARG